MAINPYRRMLEAAKRGRGVRLTAEECRVLERDDAIVQRATMLDDDPDNWRMQIEDPTGSSGKYRV
jgi:hypothetical protein